MIFHYESEVDFTYTPVKSTLLQSEISYIYLMYNFISMLKTQKQLCIPFQSNKYFIRIYFMQNSAHISYISCMSLKRSFNDQTIRYSNWIPTFYLEWTNSLAVINTQL